MSDLTAPPSSSPRSLLPVRPASLAAFPRPWTPQVERGADMIGEVLGGRFVVRRRIGRGGMGCVYLCDDRLLRSQAAVKVLRSPDPGARRRFQAEARILAHVRHPRLVQVLAVGETEDGAPFLAMEHLPGPSLEDRLHGGPLAWRDAVEIALQVGDALAALHAAGVIHRDVKPSNIVALPSLRTRPSIKVIDLGVAKIEPGSPLRDALPTGGWLATDTGIAVGTRAYCAPEAGLVEADPRLDVFSLGVTLYQLCTGALPRPGLYRPMRAVSPERQFPDALEALVADAIAADPSTRIPSMLDLLRRLESIAPAPVGDDDGLFASRYELLERLGTGATAEVHRAYDRDADRYVALKILRAGEAASEEERRRLTREARALGAVRHPAIPELFECRALARERPPFLAMSLARGRPASDFCLAGRTLRVAEVIAVGRQLADALAILHARGILHRDVNASNVVIERGAEARATLVDLGVAAMTPRFYAVTELRYPTPPERRISLGSGELARLAWTAPEVRAGGEWSERSDVFSVGLLLFKLLTGKQPFVDGEARVRPLREHLPRCPGPLADAVAWTLEVDPTRRCDAAELAAALDDATAELEAIEGRAQPASHGPGREAPTPVGVRPTPSIASRDRWRWRATLVVAALGLVYLGFVLGVVSDLRPDTDGRESSTQAR